MSLPDRTHYDGCWKDHHSCARIHIAELRYELDALRKDAERYRLTRNHVSLILTDDSMFLAGLRIEIFYDEPQTLYLGGPKNSFAHPDDLFDAAIDESLEQERKT